jgi:hypothetical protein
MLSVRTWAVVVAGGVSDKVDGVGHYGQAVLVTEPASYETVVYNPPQPAFPLAEELVHSKL